MLKAIKSSPNNLRWNQPTFQKFIHNVLCKGPDKNSWPRFTGEEIYCLTEKRTTGKIEVKKVNQGRVVKKWLWHNAVNTSDIQTATGTASSLVFWDPRWSQGQGCQRKNLEKQGANKRKRHSPRPDDLQFDKDGLLQEIKGVKDGDKFSVSPTIVVTQVIIILIIIIMLYFYYH